MKKKDEPNPEDYVWVLTEQEPGKEETFVGLSNEEGENFIPATATREEAMQLLALLPMGQGKRQVEAIHRFQIASRAAEQGFQVYVVDQQGNLQERLEVVAPQ